MKTTVFPPLFRGPDWMILDWIHSYRTCNEGDRDFLSRWRRDPFVSLDQWRLDARQRELEHKRDARASMAV